MTHYPNQILISSIPRARAILDKLAGVPADQWEMLQSNDMTNSILARLEDGEIASIELVRSIELEDEYSISRFSIKAPGEPVDSSQDAPAHYGSINIDELGIKVGDHLTYRENLPHIFRSLVIVGKDELDAIGFPQFDGHSENAYQQISHAMMLSLYSDVPPENLSDQTEDFSLWKQAFNQLWIGSTYAPDLRSEDIVMSDRPGAIDKLLPIYNLPLARGDSYSSDASFTANTPIMYFDVSDYDPISALQATAAILDLGKRYA